MEAAAIRERARRRRHKVLGLGVVGLVVTAVAMGFVLRTDEETDTGQAPVTVPAFVTSPQHLALAPAFDRWAREYDLPVPLLQALGWRESRWDNSVRSDQGAIGIGQLLPATSTFVARELIGEPLDPHDARDNIRISARYLRYLIDRFDGDVATGLAAYLQGSTSVAANGPTAETAAYVRDVLDLRDVFARARLGPTG